ncbi:MAG: MBL fold metallo-hydrolase, partial [Candidatus Dormibacteria bacterium]
DAEQVLDRVISPPHFPVHAGELEGNWSFGGIDAGWHEIEGFRVRALDIPHPGGRMLGYRLESAGATVCYISDHAPVMLGPGPEGFGEYHENALELAREVDLLIHDAQYTAEEFPSRALYGHSAADYAVGLASRAGARSLLLFHHDPQRTDAGVDEILAHCRRVAPADLEVNAAAEDETIVVTARAGMISNPG